MDEVQKTAFTDYTAPLSEPFRLHAIFNFGKIGYTKETS
jgi:hypothetical protein